MRLSQISIFRNIYETVGKYSISIQDALNRIKDGKSAKAIISLRSELDKSRQDNLKKSLPSVTFSGVFTERADDKLVTHSGFICLDFDDVNVKEYILKFKDWKYTYACWISPRATGVKVLLKISDGTKHRDHFAALKKLFPETDEKCSNPSRVSFESYDPDIYINTTSETFKETIKYEVIATVFNSDKYETYKKLQTWLEKSNNVFSEGNRNQYIFVLASAMCRYGISQDDSEQMLTRDYASQNFSDKEVGITVGSAYKANKNNFGSAEFRDEKLSLKETKIEVDPKIFQEGFKLVDIIYGSEVYESAVEIYNSGYVSAETTFIPALDKYFKLKRGEITLLSGIGNSGKSLYFNQLCLIQSLKAGKKWAVFSPESNPAHEYYFDLVESLVGSPCDASYYSRPPREVFDRAYEFVSNHFYFVYPETISPTPEYIKTKFLELILKEKVDGVIIDPFNQLANDYVNKRSDKYLETFLSDCTRFAQRNGVYFWIIAHPHKLQKNGALDYPCPDVFEIADGAMWNNKMDNILIYHRPLGQSDPNSPICEHHSKKIKRQKQVGMKGMFEFEYNRGKRRFYFDGFSPLDGNPYEQVYVPKKMVGNPNIFEEEQPY